MEERLRTFSKLSEVQKSHQDYLQNLGGDIAINKTSSFWNYFLSNNNLMGSIFPDGIHTHEMIQNVQLLSDYKSEAIQIVGSA